MHDNFIGTGANPNPGVPALPVGLGMELAQYPRAMEIFSGLSDERKTALIGHIQGALTGEEAKNRVTDAVARLGEGDVRFF